MNRVDMLALCFTISSALTLATLLSRKLNTQVCGSKTQMFSQNSTKSQRRGSESRRRMDKDRRVHLWAVLLLPGAGVGEAVTPSLFASCVFEFYLNSEDGFYIVAPQYSNPYLVPLHCEWRGWSPSGTMFRLWCLYFLVPTSHHYCREGLLWWSGNYNIAFCGYYLNTLTTSSNTFIATLYSR